MSKNSFDPKAKKIIISFLVFIVLIIIGVAEYTDNVKKEKEMDKNLVGYTLKNEQLVDNCNLVNVEGFYLGKGILNGATRYIFQVEKDNQISNNIEVTDKELEINYVPKDNTSQSENKPGTVKAYSRTYVKKDKNGKSKTQNVYFYKMYIPENTIKDCGTLVDSSTSNSDEQSE